VIIPGLVGSDGTVTAPRLAPFDAQAHCDLLALLSRRPRCERLFLPGVGGYVGLAPSVLAKAHRVCGDLAQLQRALRRFTDPTNLQARVQRRVLDVCLFECGTDARAAADARRELKALTDDPYHAGLGAALRELQSSALLRRYAAHILDGALALPAE
jgi:hypothetical protein